MMLPNQSPPVARRVSPAAMLKAGVAASDSVACQICHAGCGALPWPASIACNLVCDNTVCKL
jgi:hypothetical protein